MTIEGEEQRMDSSPLLSPNGKVEFEKRLRRTVEELDSPNTPEINSPATKICRYQLSKTLDSSHFSLLTECQLQSLACLSGVPPIVQPNSLPCLIEKINAIFAEKARLEQEENHTWFYWKPKILEALQQAKLSERDVVKYTHFDSSIPYTRNLIATDGENYSLLLLCWTPGYESKIHNHPCDGCFVRGIAGKVTEHRYIISSSNPDEIILDQVHTCEAGDVTYMDDSLGLHKIGNTSAIHGAITLHLYTPPYYKCKIWTDGDLKVSSAAVGYSVHYSEYGVRQAGMKKTDLACYI